MYRRYNGGFLPDNTLLSLCYYDVPSGTHLNSMMSAACSSSQCSHLLRMFRYFSSDGLMLGRFRGLQIFMSRHNHHVGTPNLPLVYWYNIIYVYSKRLLTVKIFRYIIYFDRSILGASSICNRCRLGCVSCGGTTV